jgi:CBS domain-containing protein
MSRSVVSLAVTATVADAREALLDQRVSALPVLDSHSRPVGMVTKTDLVASLAEDLPVAMLMSSRVLTCAAETSVFDAARVMRTNHVHHLVVVHDDRAVGVLSVFDLLEVFDRFAESE